MERLTQLLLVPVLLLAALLTAQVLFLQLLLLLVVSLPVGRLQLGARDGVVRTPLALDRLELPTKVTLAEMVDPMRVVEAVALALLEVLVLQQQAVTEGRVFTPALRGLMSNAQVVVVLAET